MKNLMVCVSYNSANMSKSHAELLITLSLLKTAFIFLSSCNADKAKGQSATFIYLLALSCYFVPFPALQ